MTPVAGRRTRVLLDTSAFINFAQGGALLPLSAYLGSRAAITLDVDNELRRNAAGRFPALKTLSMLRWPAGEPLALPPDLLALADDLRRLESAPGAHVGANRGEIATVLVAARIDEAVVIMDDHLGRTLAARRGVARLSSAQLAAEMTIANALDEEMGLAVFMAATPVGVGRAEFEAALERARAARE